LAHDVYIYAFEKYGLAIFQNIANSESQHSSSILALMDSYQINDPLKDNTSIGQFADPVIKSLHNQLTSRVDLNLEEAIKVRLLIEDMDINDLGMGIGETSNTAIAGVYSKLWCGSYNHMRSFENLATAANATYSPEFISLELYNSIINSPMVTCGNQ
jgi:hypothetical protein